MAAVLITVLGAPLHGWPALLVGATMLRLHAPDSVRL